jgi:hypothetical protein
MVGQRTREREMHGLVSGKTDIVGERDRRTDE